MLKAVAALFALLSLPAHAGGKAPPCVPLPEVDDPIDLTLHDPAPRVIEGTSFPRNGWLLYRGGDPESPYLSLELALRAMMGDRTAFVESRVMSRVVRALTGERRFSRGEYRDPVGGRGFGDYGFERDVEGVLPCAGERARYSPGRARILAARLMDRAFRRFEAGRMLVPRLLDYLYQDEHFPLWDDSVVFSTVFPDIAAIYGRGVLVFRESEPRSFDLTYRNFVEHGLWSGNDIQNRNPEREFGDYGEFISPGYIAPRDIRGYEYRNGGLWNEATLRWALRKIPLGRERAVVVLEGRGRYGVRPHPEEPGWFAYCERSFRSAAEARPTAEPCPLPASGAERAAVAGVLITCPLEGECAAERGLPVRFAGVPRAESRPGRVLRERLERFRAPWLEGKRVRYMDLANP